MIPPLRLLPCLLATLLPACSQPASKGGAVRPTARSGYKAESPLPKGWPEPGPFNQAVRKQYPAYRAAFTPESSPNGGFRRLFTHISRHRIPMTAPVAMTLDPSKPDRMPMQEMAFLYQSPEVGKAGEDGEMVEVRDMPAQEALSYAWQGPRNDAATAKARAAIDAELAARNLKAKGYRLLGYNSPFIPRSRQTHELQALVK